MKYSFLSIISICQCDFKGHLQVGKGYTMSPSKPLNPLKSTIIRMFLNGCPLDNGKVNYLKLLCSFGDSLQLLIKLFQSLKNMAFPPCNCI